MAFKGPFSYRHRCVCERCVRKKTRHSFLNFSYACPETAVVKRSTKWRENAAFSYLSRARAGCAASGSPPKKRVCFLSFPMFVPSLSWQNDRFYI